MCQNYQEGNMSLKKPFRLLCKEAASEVAFAKHLYLFYDNNKEAIDHDLANDDNFYKDIRQFLLKLSLNSVVNYIALVSRNLIVDNRKLAFAQINAMTFASFSTCEQKQKSASYVTRVSLFLLIMSISTTSGEKLNLQINKNFIKLESKIQSIRYFEQTERFSMKPILTFLENTDKALSNLESFLDFTANHKTCKNFGDQNSLTDNLANILQIINKDKINKVSFNHQENSSVHSYVSTLKHIKNGSFVCHIGYTLNQIQYLMTFNNKRSVTKDRTHINFLNHLLKNFSDIKQRQCIRHGKLKKYFYQKIFIIKEPAIESCALSCFLFNRNRKSVKELKFKKFDFIHENLMGCEVYSYDMLTKTCYLGVNISNHILIDNINFYGTNKFSFTGQFDCLPNNYNTNPIILYNDKQLSLFDMCKFEPNLIFENTLSQCKRLYLHIQRPLKKLSKSLENFRNEFNMEHMLKTRTKRALLSNVLFKSMINAAKSQGITLLTGLINNISDSPQKLLTSLTQRIKSVGFKAKYVHTKLNRSENLNINNFLIAKKSLETKDLSSIESDHLSYIQSFEEYGQGLETYFKKLILYEEPLKNQTKLFLINSKSYVYSSFVDTKQNEIVRQFVVSKISDYFGTEISIIPIGNTYFFKDILFQHDTLYAERTDTCILNLLKEDNLDRLNLCSGLKTKKVSITNNLMYLHHNFKNTPAKILIINSKGFLEVLCKKGWINRHIIGFSVFLLSDDCKVLYDNLFILQADDKILGFEPMVIFNTTHFYVKDVGFEYFQELNSGIMGFFLLILILICYYIYVKYRTLKRGTANTYIKNKVFEEKNINLTEMTPFPVQ